MERRDELMDRGWKMMAATLDREMPVKRKRRVPFWIFLLFLGLTIAAAAIWYTQNSSSDIPSQSKTDNQLANTASPTNSQNERSVTEIQRPDSRETEGIMAIDENNTSQLESNDDFRRNDNTSDSGFVNPATTNVTQNKTVGGSVVKGSYTDPGNTRARSSAMKNLAVQTDLKLETAPEWMDRSPSVLAASPVASSEDRDVVSPFPPIPSKSVTAIKEGAATGQPAVDLYPARYKVKLGMDVYGAGHLGASPLALKGVEGGLLATASVSPRLSLSTGLGYGHYDIDGIVELSDFASNDDEQIALVDLPDSNSFGIARTIEYDQLNFDTARQLLTTLDYLHIPVFADYQVNRWLKVRAGLRVSHLLKAPPAPHTPPVTGVFPGSNLADAEPVATVLFDEDLVRRWDVAPLVGVAISLGGRVSLDLQYQLGLIPIVNREANSRDDYNRSLSLGVRYSLF